VIFTPTLLVNPVLIPLRHNIDADEIWVIRATYWGNDRYTNQKSGSHMPPEFVVQLVKHPGFVPETR
jgi:hypothetical protein